MVIRFIITTFTIVSLIFLVNYKLVSSQRDLDAKESSRIASELITKQFDHLEKVMTLTGKEIIDRTPDLNLKTIHKILETSANSQIKTGLLSWTSLGWTNLEGYQVTNATLGIIRNPPYMIDRNYRDSANDSWKLIFSEVDNGTITGQLIIPVGMQIEIEKKKRLGTINCGININELTNLINSRLKKYERFMVVDNRDNKIIFDYAGRTEKTKDSLQSSRILTNNGNFYVESVVLSSRYPFTVITGYSLEDFHLEVIRSATKQLILIFSILLLVIVTRGRRSV